MKIEDIRTVRGPNVFSYRPGRLSIVTWGLRPRLDTYPCFAGVTGSGQNPLL